MPAKSSFLPKVAIGITSGEMISGNIGSTTLKCLDFTVMSDVVNTAQRLQTIAEDGQIIISESCYQKVRQSFNCKALCDFNLKNKETAVRIYEVLN